MEVDPVVELGDDGSCYPMKNGGIMGFNHQKWWYYGILPTKLMILMGFVYIMWVKAMPFYHPIFDGLYHP